MEIQFILILCVFGAFHARLASKFAKCTNMVKRIGRKVAKISYKTVIQNSILHLSKGLDSSLSQKSSGGELTREKVRGAIVHKAGRKYQHD
jgi:hypothetical protein